jgi:hypothetical protein
MLAHIELFEWWDGLQGEVGGGNYRGAFDDCSRIVGPN